MNFHDNYIFSFSGICIAGGFVLDQINSHGRGIILVAFVIVTKLLITFAPSVVGSILEFEHKWILHFLGPFSLFLIWTVPNHLIVPGFRIFNFAIFCCWLITLFEFVDHIGLQFHPLTTFDDIVPFENLTNLSFESFEIPDFEILIAEDTTYLEIAQKVSSAFYEHASAFSCSIIDCDSIPIFQIAKTFLGYSHEVLTAIFQALSFLFITLAMACVKYTQPTLEFCAPVLIPIGRTVFQVLDFGLQIVLTGFVQVTELVWFFANTFPILFAICKYCFYGWVGFLAFTFIPCAMWGIFCLSFLAVIGLMLHIFIVPFFVVYGFFYNLAHNLRGRNFIEEGLLWWARGLNIGH